ncbi:MAG TPA: hypothetical protein VD833_08125 [Vicinamibacterales bacterium]|nr:hypothetical protein [Vicinamibacterales bacterium]
MDVPEVRRRLRAAIERARLDARGRRERSDAAAREFDRFLTERATPVLQILASALVAEGHRFKVFTPAGSVRLSAEGSADDYIELWLDSAQDPPAVVGRVSRGRGRRQVSSERPVREGVAVADLTDSDVLDFVLAEIGPFVER